MSNSYRSKIHRLRIMRLQRDTVSEQDKTSSRKDTRFVVVPFPVGVESVDEISYSNFSSNGKTASSCVHCYKVSRIVVCLRGVGWKGIRTE